MQTRWVIVALLWITLCVSFIEKLEGLAFAEPATSDKAVVVTGTGKLQGNDIEGSRTQAVANGLIGAVDRAVSDLMTVSERVQRFQAVDKVLFSAPERFVLNYKILTEAAIGKNYRVLMDVTLSMSALQNALADTTNTQGKTVEPKPSNEVRSVTLVVDGARQLSNFVNFRNMLKSIPTVLEVETSGIKPNSLTMLIQLRGTAQALGEALMQKPMENFNIQILEATEDFMHLSLIDK
jgi:hypothetical protein